METLKPTPENFEKHTLRLDYDSRGGGIEIDLTPFGYEDHKMAAYQNHLGGGMLGRICVNDTFTKSHSFIEESLVKDVEIIGEELKKYFHSLTNHDNDEWESMSYEQNQKMPVSAY